MEQLEYRCAFHDHPAGRAAVNAMLVATHGLDLRKWDERVGWDPAFVPFAFCAADRIVALTCIYVLDMMIDGTWRRVAQVSSVGTLPAFRQRGLNAELTRRARAWCAAQDLAGPFLFSDDDATGFYAKQGFVEIPEFKHRVAVAAEPRPSFRLLGYDADEELIRRLVESRTPVSHRLGVRSPRLELFHLLYENAGDLRYVQDVDLLVCCEEEGDLLRVYDVIGPEMVPWNVLEPLVIGPRTKHVEFEITPDRLRPTGAAPIATRASRLHVPSGGCLFGGQVIVPCTAHA